MGVLIRAVYGVLQLCVGIAGSAPPPLQPRLGFLGHHPNLHPENSHDLVDRLDGRVAFARNDLSQRSGTKTMLSRNEDIGRRLHK